MAARRAGALVLLCTVTLGVLISMRENDDVLLSSFIGSKNVIANAAALAEPCARPEIHARRLSVRVVACCALPDATAYLHQVHAALRHESPIVFAELFGIELDVQLLTQWPAAADAAPRDAILLVLNARLPACQHQLIVPWTHGMNFTATYPALVREPLIRLVETARARVRAPGIRIAFLNVWTGQRSPSPNFIASSKAFANVTNAQVLIFADAASNLALNVANIRVHLIANLTDFIFAQTRTLVPLNGYSNGVKYELGRKVCDYRALFGGIFERFIPENEFTHWAWMDAHSRPGDMFGALTDYGYDFARFDIVSFTCVWFYIIVLECRSNAARAQRAALLQAAHTSGHLTIFTNTAHGRGLYKHCLSYSDVVYGTSALIAADELQCSLGWMRASNVSMSLRTSPSPWTPRAAHTQANPRHTTATATWVKTRFNSEFVVSRGVDPDGIPHVALGPFPYRVFETVHGAGDVGSFFRVSEFRHYWRSNIAFHGFSDARIPKRMVAEMASLVDVAFAPRQPPARQPSSQDDYDALLSPQRWGARYSALTKTASGQWFCRYLARNLYREENDTITRVELGVLHDRYA